MSYNDFPSQSDSIPSDSHFFILSLLTHPTFSFSYTLFFVFVFFF